MTNDISAAPVAPKKKGKGALVTGAVLLVLGILAVVLGVAVVGNTVKALADSQVGESQTAPTTISAPLEAATVYAVYEASDGATKVKAADVTVTDSKGNPVTVEESSGTTSVSGKDGKTYAEVATFTIGTSDTFTVKVATEGSVVAVAPSVASASKGFAFFAAIIVGILLGIIGVILLIIGGIRRAAS